MSTPNTKRDQLISKLKEMFQMDQADLDFGIYRIMNAKRDEVERFLDKDLLPTLRTTLEEFQPAGLADKKKELADAIANARKLKIDPDTLEVVQQLKAELADGGDLDRLENQVYSDLHTVEFHPELTPRGSTLDGNQQVDGLVRLLRFIGLTPQPAGQSGRAESAFINTAPASSRLVSFNTFTQRQVGGTLKATARWTRASTASGVSRCLASSRARRMSALALMCKTVIPLNWRSASGR